MQSFMKFGALVAAISPLVATQTFTSCNPMVNASCPADPAFCSNFETDFTKGAMTGWKATAGALTYGADGAKFTINKRGDAPTIQTDNYLHFGYVEVKMKAATGTGIISSIVLQSDDLDEVDWEFIGGDNGNVQTNYFGKGNTTTYDRMTQFAVATPHDTFHTYAVNWTQQSMVWLIDGKAVRTLNYADAVGGKNFPQTPVNVRLGIWAGGDESNNAGTISWAGGKTDYTKGPFSMIVQSVKVINYSPGKEYQFTDKSGAFSSIKTVEGACGSSSSNSTGVPGGFFPTGNSSTTGPDHGQGGDESCTLSTVTVTVTGGEGNAATPPPVTPKTTVVSPVTSAATPTSLPSSIAVDTSSPTVRPTSALPVGNATATGATPSAFTGAAGKLDSSNLVATSFIGVLLGLLAL